MEKDERGVVEASLLGGRGVCLTDMTGSQEGV